MHYNAAYYESHYGRLLGNDHYFGIRALYWRAAINAVQNVPDQSLILDYGCGTGQVSMAFPNTHYYDIAPFSRELIGKRGRIVYEEAAKIPLRTFDFILSSHALEHTPRPFEELLTFGNFAKPGGLLLLILPIENDFRPTRKVDGNNHLFCWTFQTITNLLLVSGWEPLTQAFVYDSFGLGTLSKLLPPQNAVSLSWKLGRIKRSFKSMIIVARNGKP